MKETNPNPKTQSKTNDLDEFLERESRRKVERESAYLLIKRKITLRLNTRH